MKKQPRPRIFILNDPYPMRISGALAEEIGLNESILLLQIEFLISISGHERDGKLWTYQSLQEMKDKYFRWWSLATISRTAKNLEAAGLIHIGNYNKAGYDRTQWYALNEEGINKLASVAILQNEKRISHPATPILQNEKSFLQNETTIPETTTETTTEKGGESASAAPAPVAEQTSDTDNRQSHKRGKSDDYRQASKPDKKTAWPGYDAIPPDWLAYGEQSRPELNIDAVFASFRDYCVANGTRYASWLAAWQRWVRETIAKPHLLRNPQSKPSTRPRLSREDQDAHLLASRLDITVDEARRELKRQAVTA